MLSARLSFKLSTAHRTVKPVQTHQLIPTDAAEIDRKTLLVQNNHKKKRGI